MKLCSCREGYIWQVALKEDVLLIKWIHSVYIKEANWWEHEAPITASSMWKVICKTKNVLQCAYHNNKWLNEEKLYTQGYKWLKGSQMKAGQHNRVWRSYNTAKHLFIARMMKLEQLKSRDRLKYSRFCQESRCLLCYTEEETSHHLFFRCPSSRRICQGIMNWIGIRMNVWETVYTGWVK